MIQQFSLKQLLLGIACLNFSFATAQDKALDTFRIQRITDIYYSEGAATGDLNNDGKIDFVYGPHWYEGPSFEVEHDIYPAKPQNKEGYTDHFFAWVFDFDADGWKDVFTVGLPGTPAFVYQNPGNDNAAELWKKHRVFDWVPFKAADESGIGRQIGLFDLNQDGLLDIAVGGMKGAHALFHQRSNVAESIWRAAQPVRQVVKPVSSDKAILFEGEKLKVLAVTGGAAKAQGMAGFSADHWSNDSQLWWIGGKKGSRLDLEIPVAVAGKFDVLMAFTKAPDYGIVRVILDGVKLGEPIDLFNAKSVISTGVIQIGQKDFKSGSHKLTLEIVGKNPFAVPGYMVGLDSVQLGVDQGDAPKSKVGKALKLNLEKGTPAVMGEYPFLQA